jgi:hypothetical protein
VDEMVGIKTFLAGHLKAACITDDISILIAINTFFFMLAM